MIFEVLGKPEGNMLPDISCRPVNHCASHIFKDETPIPLCPSQSRMNVLRQTRPDNQISYLHSSISGTHGHRCINVPVLIMMHCVARDICRP